MWCILGCIVIFVAGIAAGGFGLFFLVAGEGWIRNKLRKRGLSEEQVNLVMNEK